MKLKSLSQKDRYGNMFSVEFFEPDTTIPMMMVIPDMPDGFNGADTDNHPGDPKGTDTVPAWLTPGENVVNAEASRIPGNQEKIDQMNEEGRQIQKSQGGPIPTYESEGGFIQGVTDFFTMPTPPAGSGIEYRRHKDGSIGIWAGNTYRGKYKEPAKKESSFSDRLGISYNYGGGNIPPMYAQEGTQVPSWLTDDLLDSLKMVESGGDPNALSEAGARGAYQIMPSTAQKPGMGVTPLAVEDLNDPTKSRRFAQDYLTAIARENPDFTQEEVITAYHSGAGNVRKAKEGTEALGPRGEAYAGKVMDGTEDVSFLDQAGNVLSELNPFGVKEASAQSTLVPKQDQTPPKEEDEGFFSPQVKRFLQYPLESFGMPVPEDAPGKPVGNKLFGTESTIIKEEQAERALKYPAEFLGIPAPVDAPGVPLPNVFDLLPDQDKTLANLNEMRVDERQSKVDRLASRINENQEKGIPVSPELVAAHKEATASLTEAQQTQQQHASEIGAEVAKAAEATAQAQTYNTETGEFDKPTQQDEYEEASGTTATDQQKAALTNAAASAPNSEQPPSGDPDANKEIEETGKTADPTLVEQAKEAFKGAFGDLFNPKELARMALLYTGSRLMGYSHEGSFAYGAKSYLSRIDAMDAQFQKDIRDDDYQDFTKESRELFEQTRDYSVLEKKPPVPQGVSGTSGTKYDRNTGKIVQVYTVGEGANKRLVVNDNGKLVPATSNRFEVVQAETHNLAKVTDRFQTALQSKMEEVNRGITDKEGTPLDFSTQELAQESANFYNTTRQLFRMDVNASQRLRSEILGAQADYMEAMRLHAEKKGDKPTSIEGFYNRRVINLRTGDVVSFNDVKNTDVEKLADLENQLMRLAKNEAVETKSDAGEIYRKFWQDAKDDWSKMKSKGSFTSGKTPGYDPFIAWVQATVIKDPDALKLAEESNLKK